MADIARWRKKSTGTDIWFKGWLASFPPGGLRPGLRKSPKAPTGMTKIGDDVKLGQIDSETELCFGGWILTFGTDSDNEPKVEPVDPTPARVPPVVRYKRIGT
jgi:hypothetical protein